MPKPKPFISRAGGKSRLLKHLLPLIASQPHTLYCEVFGGGAAVLFGKERSKVECYNDLDGELSNAFKQVRYHADAVCAELDFRINSRADFYEARDEKGTRTEVQRAADYIFINTLSFGGNNDSYGVTILSKGGATTSLINKQQALLNASQRLDRVMIENISWERMLKNYDSPETLFFLDPPYVAPKSKSVGYTAWTIEQASDLIAALKKIKGHWILTLNDSAETRDLLHGYIKKHLQTTASIKASSSRFSELIATSF